MRPGCQESAVFSTPALATQATCSFAAPTAPTQRWICTSISATLATGTNPQTIITLNLRAGATGAGTIIWSKQIILAASSVWELNLTDLSLPGAYATAMTLEFSAAGVALSYESVAMTGYLAS